jgi:hypothetical protein
MVQPLLVENLIIFNKTMQVFTFSLRNLASKDLPRRYISNNNKIPIYKVTHPSIIAEYWKQHNVKGSYKKE